MLSKTCLSILKISSKGKEIYWLAYGFRNLWKIYGFSFFVISVSGNITGKNFY
jgi:hypothetical protein